MRSNAAARIFFMECILARVVFPAEVFVHSPASRKEPEWESCPKAASALSDNTDGTSVHWDYDDAYRNLFKFEPSALFL
jgi:hypothetical protein